MCKHQSPLLIPSVVALLSAPALQAALLMPVSTSQKLEAKGTIEESGLSESQIDDPQSLMSSSFSDDAVIIFSLPGGSGEASASSSLDSQFLTDAIKVNGLANAYAKSGPGLGVTDTAQSSAHSTFTYKFQVSQPVTYSLSGSVSGVAPDGGPASYANYVSLRVDGGTVLFSSPGDNDPFADSGSLVPDVTYVLAGHASASAFDFQAQGIGASAGYGFEFSVVPEPHHGVLALGLGMLGFGAVRRFSGRFGARTKAKVSDQAGALN